MSAKTKRKSARVRPAKRPDLLQRAVRSHGSGRLDDAERGYLRFLELNKDHPVALHNLGLLLNESGRSEQAIANLERAAELAPDDASIPSNLGNMLQARGDLDGAERYYRAALDIDPAHANASYNLAAVLQDRGKLAEAIDNYRLLLGRMPRDAGVCNNLGSALLANGQLTEAVEVLERALAIEPRYPRAMLNLGMARLNLDDLQGAEQAFRGALELKPDLAEAHQNLASLLNRQDRLEEAHHHLGRALALRPDSAKSLRLFGRVCMQLNEPDEAIEAFKLYLRFEQEDVQIWCELGAALSSRGRIAEAVAAIGRAQSLEPESPRVVYATGLAQLIQGNTEAARDALQRAGALYPDSPEVWFNVAKTRHFGPEDENLITRLATIPERRALGPSAEAHLHFTLGKVHDDRGRPEQAFEHYAKGNAIMRRRVRFDPNEIPDKVERSIAVYTAEFFASVADLGSPSERSVFVFGMPRSGTTLVEQILASHPDVFGAGELTKFPELAVRSTAQSGDRHEYPESMRNLSADVAEVLCEDYLALLRGFSPDAARVTDKLPGNYLYLGAIATLFPKAKLIHCRRHPMDVCVSNYTQFFADGMPFSYGLKDLGDTYRAYERMMAHWREVLPVPMYEVEYETITAEQEFVSRELIAFCGLPWDERCLDFHENERAVNTASNWQVRQPIYRSAVARWKRYEPWLGELKEALGLDDDGARGSLDADRPDEGDGKPAVGGGR